MASLQIVHPVHYAVLNSLMELPAKLFASFLPCWLALECTVDPFCRTESNFLVLLILKLLPVWIQMPLLIYPFGLRFVSSGLYLFHQFRDTDTCCVVAVY